MKSSFLLLSANIFLIVVHALPLDHHYVMPKTPGEPLQPATEEFMKENPNNKKKFEEAMGIANDNLDKMTTVLDNHTDPKNKALIVAAFGEKTYTDNLDGIKANVQAIQNANLPVDLTKGVFNDGAIAVTHSEQTSGGEFSPTHVQMGEKFYTPFRDKDVRAGTIIHEAAHYAVGAGHLSELKTLDLPNKIEDVAKKNPEYARRRDIARNMQNNAESYAVFGNLCAHNTRREYIRALEAGDYHTASKIYRRDGASCALPARKQAGTKSIPQSNKPNTAVAQPKSGPINKASAAGLQKATQKSGSTTSLKSQTESRPNSLVKANTPKVGSQRASRPQSAGSGSKLSSAGRGSNKSPAKSDGRGPVQGKPNVRTTSTTSNGRKSNAGPAKSSGRQVPQVSRKQTTKQGTVPASRNGPLKGNSKQTRPQNLAKQGPKSNQRPVSSKALPKTNSKPASPQRLSKQPSQRNPVSQGPGKQSPKPASQRLGQQPSQRNPVSQGPGKQSPKPASQRVGQQPSQRKPVSQVPGKQSPKPASQRLSQQPSRPNPVPQGQPVTPKAPPTLNSKPAKPQQQPLVKPKKGKP